jgi:hypothetical protein
VYASTLAPFVFADVVLPAMILLRRLDDDLHLYANLPPRQPAAQGVGDEQNVEVAAERAVRRRTREYGSK